MENIIHPLAIQLIQHYEGLHDGDLRAIGLQPKLCPAGYATIGWGHVVIDPVTNKPCYGSAGLKRALQLYPAMTREEADALLVADLTALLVGVKKLVKPRLADEQFGALVSLAYNIGIGPFGGSTLLKKVNANNLGGAAAQFPRWNKARVKGVLTELPGLTFRRKSEQLLFAEGVFKSFN